MKNWGGDHPNSEGPGSGPGGVRRSGSGSAWGWEVVDDPPPPHAERRVPSTASAARIRPEPRHGSFHGSLPLESDSKALITGTMTAPESTEQPTISSQKPGVQP